MGKSRSLSTSSTGASAAQQLPLEVRAAVKTFAADLAAGNSKGSLPTSLATIKLIRRVLGSAAWTDAQEAMDALKESVGDAFDAEDPSQVVVGNVVRRVLKLIREEHASAIRAEKRGKEGEEEAEEAQETAVVHEEEESLHKMLVTETSEEGQASKTGEEEDNSIAKEPRGLRRKVANLKSKVMESIDELTMELESASEEIANQALEHIHASEVILTLGRSRTVEMFLKHAAKERKFQVIVAECGAPLNYQGQAMAASLAKANIQTTVITDSAIFAVMSRVNKVILGTSAILADGGLKAVAGIRHGLNGVRGFNPLPF